MQKDWNTVLSVSDFTNKAPDSDLGDRGPGRTGLVVAPLLSPYFKAIKFGWSGASEGVREMLSPYQDAAVRWS